MPAPSPPLQAVPNSSIGLDTLEYLVDCGEGYDPDNIVAVDINEDNVTAAVFLKRVLKGFFRVETGFGRIAIAYSERRRISQGRSTSNRAVRKALEKLREKERKEDIVHKVARVIEDLAVKYSARVIMGDVYRDKDKILTGFLTIG